MKVKILGSSTTWTTRAVSSYVVDGKILIDCGPSTYKRLLQEKFDHYAIKYIFITHLHSDHILGIDAFIADYCDPDNKNKEGFQKLIVYGPKGIKKRMKLLKKYFCMTVKTSNKIKIEDFIHIIEIKDLSKKINIPDYEILTYPLNHGDMDDIGYIINDGKTKLGFSGDCTYDQALISYIENLDVCFIDCARLKTGKNHLGYDRLLELQSKYKNKKFYMTHYSNEIFEKIPNLEIEAAIEGEEYKF